jgi:hypothetical protein
LRPQRRRHEAEPDVVGPDLWFGIGGGVGAGIFVLTGQEARDAAGPAVVVSYAVSGLSVFCYTEFAVEIPVAGGSFAYLRVELGDLMAFVAVGNVLLEYCIGDTSYFATLLNHRPDEFRVHAGCLAAGRDRGGGDRGAVRVRGGEHQGLLPAQLRPLDRARGCDRVHPGGGTDPRAGVEPDVQLRAIRRARRALLRVHRGSTR